MEFTIEKRPDLQFRTREGTAIEMLALQVLINFNDFGKTKDLFSFVLEHIDVKVVDSWLPVKDSKADNVYYPVGIEKELNVLTDLVAYYIKNVIEPLFPRSNK